MIDVSNEDFKILKRIAKEIDEFFRLTNSIKEARSTDIYDFIKRRDSLLYYFDSGIEFNRFLKKMHKSGLLKKVIPNSIVDDTSKTNFYQWRFYRKTEKEKEVKVNAQTGFCDTKFFKGAKTFVTNNGDFVRSTQEQFIYNQLLNEDDLLIYYERPLIDKHPDFTIANKKTNTVYIWEHFGMTNKTSYTEKITDRIDWYIAKGYSFIENGGRLIVTYYRDDNSFKMDVNRIIKLIKSPR